MGSTGFGPPTKSDRQIEARNLVSLNIGYEIDIDVAISLTFVPQTDILVI